jgi:UDP-N-acetylmuramoyl-L-alanyl-D-glutamate--2,6-diaminopimelate ligase
MALLKDILYKVPLVAVTGSTNVEVLSITADSRKAEKGSLFVAVKGTVSDGHSYIENVIKAGANIIVCETLPAELASNCTYIQVTDSAFALGVIACNYYDNPSEKLKLVGVTGTNGKTTNVTLLYKLFKALGYKVGMLSTVENYIHNKVIPATHTTPDAINLNKLLNEMVEEGCDYVFMEVSSHALVQHRVAGIQFAGAVFTNITQDHLDFHGTFDNYIAAKKMLFDMLPSSAFALINVDDRRGNVMLQNTKASKNVFSLKTMADYKAKILSNTFEGLNLDIDGHNVWFKLIGNFNAYNLLGVYATAVLLNQDKMEVLQHLSALDTAKGRFDYFISDTKITAIIDYAHTPDALENVLNTIQNIRGGNEQVITVVGCGGNRDKGKRPLMADIACKLSNRVILTSDNPRDEEPTAIIEDMQKGVKITDMRKVLSITDRKEAIKTACNFANANDIILVAGKGHENYQEIKGVKSPFDDKEIVKEMLNLLNK